jgi:hypothetical protein
MIQQLRQSTGAQLLLVALLLVGVFAAVPAAGVVLDGDGNDYVTGFNASEDQTLNYTLEPDGSDFGTDGTETIYMNVTYNDVEHLSTSKDISSSTVNATFNQSQDKLATLPGVPGQNTTVTVHAWGENSNGTVTTAIESFAVDIEFADDRSVMYLGNTSTDAIDIEEFEPSWFAENVPFSGTIPFVEDPDQADTYTIEETREIVGSQTDITMHLADSDLESGFSEQTEEFEVGGPLLATTVSVDDELVPVFYQESSDIVGDNDTYAVYDDGQIDIMLGDGYSNASSVDVSAASHGPLHEDLSFEMSDVESAYNDELTVSTLRKQFGILDIGIIDWAMAGGPFAGLMAALLVPVIVRRRDEEA